MFHQNIKIFCENKEKSVKKTEEGTGFKCDFKTQCSTTNKPERA